MRNRLFLTSMLAVFVACPAIAATTHETANNHTYGYIAPDNGVISAQDCDGTASDQPLYYDGTHDTGTFTLTADWEADDYTISYVAGAGCEGDGDTFTGDSTWGLTYDATWRTRPWEGVHINARQGYSAPTQWKTSCNSEGRTYAFNTVQSAWTSTDGLTLYACCPAIEYTISYLPGTAGTHQSGYVTDSTASQTVTVESTNIQLRANGFTAPGYHFVGWQSSVNLENNNAANTLYGSGSNDSNDDWTMPNPTIVRYRVFDDVSLTAKWAANKYTVTYKCGNGATVVGSNPVASSTTDTVTYDASYAFRTNTQANPYCAKSGYVANGWTCHVAGDANTSFAHWYTATTWTNDTVRNIGNNGVVTYNVECEAEWIGQLNLSWQTDGGAFATGQSNPATCVYGTDNDIAPIYKPTKTGYTFKGWKVTGYAPAVVEQQP